MFCEDRLGHNALNGPGREEEGRGGRASSIHERTSMPAVIVVGMVPLIVWDDVRSTYMLDPPGGLKKRGGCSHGLFQGSVGLKNL